MKGMRPFTKREVLLVPTKRKLGRSPGFVGFTMMQKGVVED